MSFDPTELRRMARRGELYPAVILHGGSAETRRELALDLARALLCEAAEEERPCGRCRHCRRIAWPEGEDVFHPDFTILRRDSKTVTSVAATRDLLRSVQLSPFEADGQVFVVADADTLSPEAADALLKVLEEPPQGAPRHFFLLCSSLSDLLPTLRSRSLPVFLGDSASGAAEGSEELARAFMSAVERWWSTGAAVFLLAASRTLLQGGGWEDARAQEPWARAAAAVRLGAEVAGLSSERRLALLALAADLLAAAPLRARGMPADRILEGLVSKRLGSGQQVAQMGAKR